MSQGKLTEEFIKAIPKTDLHLHLDGSVRISTLIDLANEQGVELPGKTEEELKATIFKESYKDLVEYLQSFPYTVAVMRKPKALERVAYELGVDCFSNNVRYIEVRFAPQLLAGEEMTIGDTLEIAAKGLGRAKEEFNSSLKEDEPEFDFGLIACAMRFWDGNFSPYYKAFWDLHCHEHPERIQAMASVSLACAVTSLKKEKDVPVVALDIAGAEEGHPADVHAEAFDMAHRAFLHKTVHAGEAYGPQSVFQAVSELHAERIGHGFHMFNKTWLNPKMTEKEKEDYVNGLVEYFAYNRICVEVCLSSNLQTQPQLKTLKDHTARQMIAQQIPFTLCTDNMTVSRTNMLKEIKLALDNFDLTPAQLKGIVIMGFRRSFQPRRYVDKSVYNQRVLDYYEKVEKEFGIDTPPLHLAD